MLIKEINYERKCWWCGKYANTREHKIKQTDVANSYGKGSYRGNDNSPLLVREGKFKKRDFIPIQSSKSDLLKFDYNLCEECNSQKSQKFDVDYDIFSKYVIDNLQEIVNTSILDFRKVFNTENFLERKHNVLKYYIKRACCDISRPTKNGTCYEISDEVRAYLNNNTKVISHFNFEFQIKLPLLLFENLIENYKHIFLKQMSGYFYNNEENGFNDAHYLYSGHTHRCFTVNYLYCLDISNSNFIGYKEYYDSPILNIEIVQLDNFLDSLENISSFDENIIEQNLEIIERLENCDRSIDDKFGESSHKKLLDREQFITFYNLQ